MMAAADVGEFQGYDLTRVAPDLRGTLGAENDQRGAASALLGGVEAAREGGGEHANRCGESGASSAASEVVAILKLPYPISANRYWASRVIKAKATGKWLSMTYVTPEAKEYRERCKAIAMASGIKTLLTGRIRLTAQLYPSRPLDWERRMRKLGESWDDSVQCIDLGNAEKVMSDALQGVVFADDCMYRRIVLDRMEPDGNGARLVVMIEAIKVNQPQGSLL